MKPYYDEDGITIYHGDCADVLPHIVRHDADLVIADPPYNVGFDYGPDHDDNLPPGEYVAWSKRWFDLARGVCPRTIVFPGHGNLPVWWEIAKPSAVGVWHKPGSQASSVIGFVDWEPWLYWTGDKGLLGGSSVIQAGVGTHTQIDGHPCPKPELLIKRLLIKCKSQAVLDPFLGSGTTLRAAKDLAIRGIGIEQNEAYCEMAVRRLSQEVLDFGKAA